MQQRSLKRVVEKVNPSQFCATIAYLVIPTPETIITIVNSAMFSSPPLCLNHPYGQARRLHCGPSSPRPRQRRKRSPHRGSAAVFQGEIQSRAGPQGVAQALAAFYPCNSRRRRTRLPHSGGRQSFPRRRAGGENPRRAAAGALRGGADRGAIQTLRPVAGPRQHLGRSRCAGAIPHRPHDLAEPRRLRRLAVWSRSRNRWRRRAAAVALLRGTDQGLFWEQVQEISQALLETATTWYAREWRGCCARRPATTAHALFRCCCRFASVRRGVSCAPPASGSRPSSASTFWRADAHVPCGALLCRAASVQWKLLEFELRLCISLGYRGLQQYPRLIAALSHAVACFIHLCQFDGCLRSAGANRFP